MWIFGGSIFLKKKKNQILIQSTNTFNLNKINFIQKNDDLFNFTN